MEQFKDRPEVPESVVTPDLTDWGYSILPAEGTSGTLFLGAKQCCDAVALPKLQAKGVTGIVNCTLDIPSPHENAGIKYCSVPVRDLLGADILPYLEGAAMFIDQHIRDGGSVVVHCERGVSR